MSAPDECAYVGPAPADDEATDSERVRAALQVEFSVTRLGGFARELRGLGPDEHLPFPLCRPLTGPRTRPSAPDGGEPVPGPGRSHEAGRGRG